MPHPFDCRLIRYSYPAPLVSRCSRSHSAIGRFRNGNVFFVLLLAGILLGLNSDCYAKPVLRGFLPRSVQLKTKTQVKIDGDFPVWPPAIWVDRQGLEIQLGNKGEMSVVTTEATLPGIYLIAFRDSAGVTDIVPLVVDSLECSIEKEPNESPLQANPVSGQTNVSGVLGKSGDVDCFLVDCKKGETLYARIRANPLFGSTMDGVIQVCDSRGFVLDQNDDKKGIDPELAVEIPSEGKYVVRVFAFPAQPNSTVRFAGGADYRYLLSLTTGPVVRLAYPLTDKPDSLAPRSVGVTSDIGGPVLRKEINSQQVLFHNPTMSGFLELNKSSADARAVVESEKIPDNGFSLPFDFSGRISQPKEMDWIAFKGVKGETAIFSVESREHGQELDPAIAIFDEKGNQLLSKDDNAKDDPDIALEFTPKTSAQYFLRIKDAAGLGGKDFYYRCRAEFKRPGFELSVPNSHFELGKDKPLEIEVQINREAGFDGAIDVSFDGLPEGVTCEPAQSKNAKDKTGKSVKLVVKSTKSFQGKFRVVGKSGELAVNGGHRFRNGRFVQDIWLTQPANEAAKK